LVLQSALAIYSTLQLLGIVRTSFNKGLLVVQLTTALGFIMLSVVVLIGHGYTWPIDFILFLFLMLFFYGVFKFRKQSNITRSQMMIVIGGSIVVFFLILGYSLLS